MASVNSVSSSSSLYGTRNVISGLASGMDTESMIENAVSGYKTKISTLQQKRTKLEWQQEAYRTIIAKAAGITDKYTSYTSSTNLASKSFFTNAVNIMTNGANKDRISATGKTSSSVRIDRVQQLATAARYSASGATLGDGVSATAEGTFNLSKETPVSTISGYFQVAYGNPDKPTYAYIDISDEVYTHASDLMNDINKQLDAQGLDFKAILVDENGQEISVPEGGKVENGTIKFVDKDSGRGNTMWITGAYGDTSSMIEGKNDITNNSFKFDASQVSKPVTTADDLETATMDITLDGQTKTIKGPTKAEVAARMGDITGKTDEEVADAQAEAYLDLLQEKIDKAFGTLANGDSKLKVENVADPAADGYEAGDIKLKFTTAAGNGSSFQVTSNKKMTMGLGISGVTNNVNTSTTMKQLADAGKITATTNDAGEDVYKFKLNDVEFEFSGDTTIEQMINQINSSEAGVKVSYSKTTNKFSFEATETGASGRVDFGDSENMKALFGNGDLTQGQDAIFQATINGDTLTLTRSSNTVDIDGLQVTLKGTFGYEQITDSNGNVTGYNPVDTEAVTFSSNVNTDKIMDAVKAFVEDYNALVTEIKNAYSTLPLQRSNGKNYEPLTEEDEADMSETDIKNWNENAKTGLLFGDQDLSGFYDGLISAVSLSGDDGGYLRSIGIEMGYSNSGLSTITLDEEKFKAALESDPDKVADIFTKRKDSGASSNGLMASLAVPLDKYAKTTGNKGILVEKAGSALSPSNLYTNYMQQQLNALDTEISKWQDKMSDKVDYYTSKFSALEQLIAQMNSQSASLSSLTGG